VISFEFQKFYSMLFHIHLGLGLLILVGSIFLIGLFRSYAIAYGLVDVPNKRSSHEQITPRGGGLVFAAIWLASVAWAYKSHRLTHLEMAILFPGPCLMTLLGYWDDHRSLSASFRLVLQLVAAGLVVYVLGSIPVLNLGSSKMITGLWTLPFTVLLLIWSTNLFNFMDGLDGLAAIEAIFVCAIGGLLFWQSGHIHLAYAAWIVVLTVLGFLFWNWPLAKIFMGDAGSYFLGFLIGLFSLLGTLWCDIPLGLWGILYAGFWFDATVTLLRRFIRGDRWYAAHCSHAFQRLYQAGWSREKILFYFIALNLILAAVTLMAYNNRELLFKSAMGAIIFCTVLYLWVEKISPMQKESLL